MNVTPMKIKIKVFSYVIIAAFRVIYLFRLLAWQ